MEIRNRAAYMVTPGKMEIRELPMPQAQPGEVVLKIEYVGVCGSDAHFFESGMRKGKAFDLPFILGRHGHTGGCGCSKCRRWRPGLL